MVRAWSAHGFWPLFAQWSEVSIGHEKSPDSFDVTEVPRLPDVKCAFANSIASVVKMMSKGVLVNSIIFGVKVMSETPEFE